MLRAWADLSDVNRYREELSGARFKSAILQVKRELEWGADRVINHAKEKASTYFDNPSKDGLAATGISRDDHAVPRGGALEITIGWLRRYGAVLEFGPKRVFKWIIKPKVAPVLRWWAAGGAGGEGPATAAGGVVYRMWAERTWTPDQKREHLGPAVKKLQPEIDQRLREAMARGIA